MYTGITILSASSFGIGALFIMYTSLDWIPGEMCMDTWWDVHVNWSFQHCRTLVLGVVLYSLCVYQSQLDNWCSQRCVHLGFMGVGKCGSYTWLWKVKIYQKSCHKNMTICYSKPHIHTISWIAIKGGFCITPYPPLFMLKHGFGSGDIFIMSIGYLVLTCSAICRHW